MNLKDKNNENFSENREPNYRYVHYVELVKIVKLSMKENISIFVAIFAFPTLLFAGIDLTIASLGEAMKVTLAIYFFELVFLIYLGAFSHRKMVLGKFFKRTKKNKDYINNRFLKEVAISNNMKIDFIYYLTNWFFAIFVIVINFVVKNSHLYEIVGPFASLFIFTVIYFINKPAICRIFIIEYDEDLRRNMHFFILNKNEILKTMEAKRKFKFNIKKL